MFTDVLAASFFVIAFSDTEMAAVRSSETWVSFYLVTRRHIPEDCTIHRHCYENINSNINFNNGRKTKYSLLTQISSVNSVSLEFKNIYIWSVNDKSHWTISLTPIYPFRLFVS
jgi:hypothetical protein